MLLLKLSTSPHVDIPDADPFPRQPGHSHPGTVLAPQILVCSPHRAQPGGGSGSFGEYKNMLHGRDQIRCSAALSGLLGAAALFSASAASLDPSERSASRAERELAEILATIADSPPGAGPTMWLRMSHEEIAPGSALIEIPASVNATSSPIGSIDHSAPTIALVPDIQDSGEISKGTVVLPRVRASNEPVVASANQFSSTPSLVESYETLPEIHKVSVTIAQGDSFYQIVRHQGFRRTNLVERLASAKHAKMLSRLRPARVLDFYVDAYESVCGLVYHLDETQSLHVERTEEGYRSRLVEKQLERRAVTAAVTVKTSVIAAARNAGVPNNVMRQVVEVLGWDVDFAKEIQSGDRIALVYEELIKNGRRVKAGDVLAVELVNKGRVIRAFRYTDENGRTSYYSPDGRSMRGAFLRTPVQFSRISSRFGARRKHPILHRVRAHHGVDYAAPTGTPIRAAGDGKVIFKGNKGGYGKTVVIQHRATYTTLYAHMSRFAQQIAHGSHVEQGQTIGYVGQSGLATGPHLHYELRIGGVHKDPLEGRAEKVASLAPTYYDDFQKNTADLFARLDLLSPTQLALNGS